MPSRDPEFASLAHDLSQLLWAIQGRARALGAGRADALGEGLSRIAEDAAAAAAMLADHDRQPASPAAATDAAWRQAGDRAAATGAEPGRWRLVRHGDAPRVVPPAHVLRRVLANLFANALDAMPAGGVVSCRGEIFGERLSWTVHDEGPGVSPDVRDRLFERGVTSGKETGHGLGLAGARTLLRRYGGDLEHLPTATGAAFRLWLPLAAAGVDTPAAAGRREVAPPARVLVVDDEESVRAMLAEMLAVDGHAARLAADRETALARFGPGDYDAVLIDLGLPGASGLDLARALRAADPALALVLLTGWGRERELAAVDPELIDFTGVKPLDQPDLQDLLARAVRLTARRRRAAPEA